MSNLTYETISYFFFRIGKTISTYWNLNSNIYFKELFKILKKANLSKMNTNEALNFSFNKILNGCLLKHLCFHRNQN